MKDWATSFTIEVWYDMKKGNRYSPDLVSDGFFIYRRKIVFPAHTLDNLAWTPTSQL